MAPLKPNVIIVGLGNPGKQYASSRHNLGFWCVDRLSHEHAIPVSQRRRLAVIGEGHIEGEPVVLAKPRTYVNRSGLAVSYLLARYRAAPETLLIIHDDLALPLGRIRIRPKGSSGGHNGIQSIIETLGTSDFTRIRVGIGRPSEDMDQVKYVLGDFSPEDREAINEKVAQVAQAVVQLVTQGLDQTMSRFN